MILKILIDSQFLYLILLYRHMIKCKFHYVPLLVHIHNGSYINKHIHFKLLRLVIPQPVFNNSLSIIQ